MDILLIYSGIGIVIWFIVSSIKESRKRKKALNILSDNPNWYELRDAIRIIRHNRCEICFGKGELHIHHIVPVSIGGGNDPQNLRLVCRNCHENIHGVIFKREIDSNQVDIMPPDYGKRRSPSGKISIIKQAIYQKNRLMIFYKKPNDRSYLPREITPIELYKRGNNIYLKAYCHLRDSERVFRVSRISKLAILS